MALLKPIPYSLEKTFDPNQDQQQTRRTINLSVNKPAVESRHVPRPTGEFQKVKHVLIYGNITICPYLKEEGLRKILLLEAEFLSITWKKMIFLWTLTLVFVSLCASQEGYKCKNLEEFDAAEKGEITNPLYSKGNYPNNLWCEYRITAPDGYRIKLTFEDMDIKPSGSCGSDKLVVYGKNKETVLGVYCGFQIPNPVLSHEDENEVRLLFETDDMGSGRGFKLTYESSPYIEMCKENEGECRNRDCYPVDKMCDGVDDCGDGTDEEDCDMPIVSLPAEDACGKTPIKPDTIYGSADRVVGGTAAVPNSWPWQVSFQHAYIEPNGHFCGGTLINAQWVISAAHCFANNPFPPTVRIHLGSHNKFNKTKFEQTRVAKKIVSYPDLEGEKVRFLTHLILLSPAYTTRHISLQVSLADMSPD
ncbi:ovochymase-1-like, partial [Stegodyphus dumicola]|uniref:ovochymase-1-like n=1 Tax=Stegodyphus dumicola TaxID=202533 RepID=UPI0015AA74E6